MFLAFSGNLAAGSMRSFPSSWFSSNPSERRLATGSAAHVQRHFALVRREPALTGAKAAPEMAISHSLTLVYDQTLSARGHIRSPHKTWLRMRPPPWPCKHRPPVGPHGFSLFAALAQGEKGRKCGSALSKMVNKSEIRPLPNWFLHSDCFHFTLDFNLWPILATVTSRGLIPIFVVFAAISPNYWVSATPALFLNPQQY